MDQSSALAEQIVTEVASGMARTRSQLKDALALSLAAKQKRLGDIDSSIELMSSPGGQGGDDLPLSRIWR